MPPAPMTYYSLTWAGVPAGLDWICWTGPNGVRVWASVATLCWRPTPHG